MCYECFAGLTCLLCEIILLYGLGGKSELKYKLFNCFAEKDVVGSNVSEIKVQHTLFTFLRVLCKVQFYSYRWKVLLHCIMNHANQRSSFSIQLLN